ncbi:hypothetical protein LIER_07427 [Lithospermum erythrorhizon]|uniref:Uncharacterized protein n=1 Tax=Lithospermum erythrorhizon TaxID=34254 RepID=A0AAV3P897_LITER
MGGGQAAHPAGPGAVIPILEENLYSLWGAAGAGHQQWHTVHSWEEDLCLELDLKHQTASVSYPQVNGQVEVMNRGLFGHIDGPSLSPRTSLAAMSAKTIDVLALTIGQQTALNMTWEMELKENLNPEIETLNCFYNLQFQKRKFEF